MMKLTPHRFSQPLVLALSAGALAGCFNEGAPMMPDANRDSGMIVDAGIVDTAIPPDTSPPDAAGCPACIGPPEVQPMPCAFLAKDDPAYCPPGDIPDRYAVVQAV